MRSDFANFYTFTDSLYDNPGGAGADGRPSLTEIQKLVEERTGIMWRACATRARDATRNQFEVVDFAGETHEIPGLGDWLQRTDFFNQVEQWLRYALAYGTAFLVAYWESEEEEPLAILDAGDDPYAPKRPRADRFAKPPPDEPPTAFAALPPTFLTPLETHQTRGVSFDQEVWSFRGGETRTLSLHRDRVFVLTPDPCPGEWRGYAIAEHVWLAATCYYNTLIYLVKGVAKWGTLVPVLKMGRAEVGSDAYDTYFQLMQDYMMNYFFLLGPEDDLTFQDARIAQGIGELVELLKEDIAAGVGIPLNILLGRSTSGGLGSQGALVSERNYLTTLAGDQATLTDDVVRMLARWFPMQDRTIRWRLALQKTTMQRLAERGAELQNALLERQLEMLDEQLAQMKLQSKMLEDQQQVLAQMPELLSQVPPDSVASDFVPPGVAGLEKLAALYARALSTFPVPRLPSATGRPQEDNT
jgi:hypothetical protein